MAVFDLFDFLVFRGSDFVFFAVPREVDFSLVSASIFDVLSCKITDDFDSISYYSYVSFPCCYSPDIDISE